MKQGIKNMQMVIDYIEAHLQEKLDLTLIAQAMHYSKYHLHRSFTDTVGMTLHDYIKRRQLTEAARALVFSEEPILAIALAAGYDSQQAFTGVFKAMYKQTPLSYREKRKFYPLQLMFTLSEEPLQVLPSVAYAKDGDISAWMDLASLVIGGFPGFVKDEHRQRLEEYIRREHAIVLRDKNEMIGAAAFSPQKGYIDFLAVHPQYRQYDVARMLLDFGLTQMLTERTVSITTFRKGDKADVGQRAAYQRLGFVEAELLTEFGYPTQRLILEPKGRKGDE